MPQSYYKDSLHCKFALTGCSTPPAGRKNSDVLHLRPQAPLKREVKL